MDAEPLQAKPQHPRSPHWHAVREAFLAKHPACVISGRTDIEREIHHRFAFEYCIELGRADLELDERNLATFGVESLENFHLFVAHAGYFASFVLDLDAMIHACHGLPFHEIIALPYWHEAVKNRVKPLHHMSAQEKQQLRQIMDHRYPLKEVA